MKALKIYISLLFLAFGVSAEAGPALVMKYHCQIGEKPGVPEYSLEIQDTKFKVTKFIALLPTTHIEAKGDLSKEDLKTLTQAVGKLPQKIDSKTEELAGSFSLDITTDGKTKSYKGTSSKKISALDPLAKWIQDFHKKYPGLSSLTPIVPGDSEKLSF